MAPEPIAERLRQFDDCRADLLALAYRMLGDFGRAEDLVQEAWLRWQTLDVAPESPRGLLITIVTRLCLNELSSARARREESRPDRLPEPIDLGEGGLSRSERLEQISMAFLVLLQRLTPAQRAVLLLHDVFDFDHREIATFVGSSAPASRKLLERARRSLANERQLLATSPEEHRRLLQAFLTAASAGDLQALMELLAPDAVLVSDGGSEGRSIGGRRNLPRPLEGAERVAAFIAATSARAADRLRVEPHELNGQPAIVFWEGRQPFAALLLAVAGGKVRRVFFHADPERLGYLGKATPTA